MFEYWKEKNPPAFFPWGFYVLDRWIQIKNRDKSLQLYFEDNGIYNIAIYGLGSIGKLLYEELCQGLIEINYGIDRNAKNIKIEGLAIKTIEESLPDVDAIVVTPVDFYGIEKNLYQKMGKDVDIIFIEDIVDYCFKLL